MADSLLMLLADILLRPKIVGSQRGTMTIHLPMLRRVSEDMVPSGIYESMAELFVGVNSFSADYETGNVAVDYDPYATSERVVLSTIKTVISTLIKYRKEFFTVPHSQRDKLFDKLKEHVASTDSSIMLREDALDLPEEIWD